MTSTGWVFPLLTSIHKDEDESDSLSHKINQQTFWVENETENERATGDLLLTDCNLVQEINQVSSVISYKCILVLHNVGKQL